MQILSVVGSYVVGPIVAAVLIAWVAAVILLHGDNDEA